MTDQIQELLDRSAKDLIANNASGIAQELADAPDATERTERIERFKQVVDTIDINAVFKAVNGVRRKRKGKNSGV